MPSPSPTRPLSTDEVNRYSRQLLLPPPFGTPESLVTLFNSHLLIIGVGGLASPLLLYLVGAGCISMTLVDGDTVDASNLHRQIIHSTEAASSQELKVHSAASRILSLNPTANLTLIPNHFTPSNFASITANFLATVPATSSACIVDCSDNPMTRYLINDAAFLSPTKLPVISGASIATDGTLTIYNYRTPTHTGPCYRCLYPSPPASCNTCSDAGVFGPVVGVVGTMQAIETVKVLLNLDPDEYELLSGKIRIYDSLYGGSRVIKIPPNPNCPLCGVEPTIVSVEDSAKLCKTYSGPSVEAACGVREVDEISVTPDFLSKIVEKGEVNFVILDVRAANQFAMCSLGGSVNIPLDELRERVAEVEKGVDVYCVCRRGVASRTATTLLREQRGENVWSVDGGLNRWSKDVDEGFPFY